MKYLLKATLFVSAILLLQGCTHLYVATSGRDFYKLKNYPVRLVVLGVPSDDYREQIWKWRLKDRENELTKEAFMRMPLVEARMKTTFATAGLITQLPNEGFPDLRVGDVVETSFYWHKLDENFKQGRHSKIVKLICSWNDEACLVDPRRGGTIGELDLATGIAEQPYPEEVRKLDQRGALAKERKY